MKSFIKQEHYAQPVVTRLVGQHAHRTKRQLVMVSLLQVDGLFGLSHSTHDTKCDVCKGMLVRIEEDPNNKQFIKGSRTQPLNYFSKM